MSDYIYPIMSETINKKELTILSVKHDKLFFYQHKPFFESFVRANDAIVLEQTVGGDFWQSDFFGSIGELVKKEGKKIYQVDPVGWGNVLYDLGTGLVGTYLCVSAMTLKSQKEIKRRDFLKKMVQLSAGISLVAGSLPTKVIEIDLDPNVPLSYGLDDELGYGVHDYRNIVIASGLDRICHEVEDLNKIGSIHGAGHSKGIYEYLLSPKKRQKRLAYLPHDLLGNTKIREYIPTSSGWKLSRTF